MKSSLLYGAGVAVGGALLTLVLYLAGYHDSGEAMRSSRWIATVGNLAIGVSGLVLAMRAKRKALSAEQNWGYGQALGAGVLTGLFAALFTLVFTYLYTTVINSQFSEMLYQSQVEQMQARGIPPEKIEQAGQTMKKFLSPVVLSIAGAVTGFLWSVLLSLIIAIFFAKRPLVASEPEVG